MSPRILKIPRTKTAKELQICEVRITDSPTLTLVLLVFQTVAMYQFKDGSHVLVMLHSLMQKRKWVCGKLQARVCKKARFTKDKFGFLHQPL